MIKGSDRRQASRPIHPMFVDRWSARAMSGDAVSEEELMTVFEAARWAPSADNEQPWRFLYARRDTAYWETYMGLLSNSNRIWCANAGALVLMISHTFNTKFNARSSSNSFDAGAAWQNLALQGHLSGLVVRGIGGFDRDRARSELHIPEDYDLEMMIGIGKPGKLADLHERFHDREAPSDRRPLEQSVCEGLFTL